MAIIVISCPRRGEDVPTGMAVDRPTWKRLPPNWAGTPFTCDRCGETHAWTKEAARLDLA